VSADPPDGVVERALATIEDTAWSPVSYPGAVRDPDTGAWIFDAEVAEIPYTAFASTTDRITARLVVRRVKDACYPDALFPVWRYHPFFTNTDLPVEAADIIHRQHAIIETVFADLIDGRWRTSPRDGSAQTPPGSCARRSPTTCCPPPACSPETGIPSARIDATPQDHQRRRPAGPPATPADSAPTHPLALVQVLAQAVGQHHRLQPTSTHDSLTTADKGRPEHTGKTGQTSSYPTPSPERSRSGNPKPSHHCSSADRGLDVTSIQPPVGGDAYDAGRPPWPHRSLKAREGIGVPARTFPQEQRPNT
jgi:hypothetical protein